jgi:Fe-S cluster biogenesis protein NfuA
MVLKLELLGACGACSMSTMTMKAGIEQAIKREVPEIQSVVAINMVQPEEVV